MTLTPWQRPQEKGIDLAIALDLIEFALTDCCDVVVVVSLDRDLAETRCRTRSGLRRRYPSGFRERESPGHPLREPGPVKRDIA